MITRTRAAMPLPECPIAGIGRVLDAPEPGFFAIRLGRGRAVRGEHGMIPAVPWSPAVIFLPCPFVEPEPYALDAAPPEDWCTPLDRAPNPLRAIVGEIVVDDPELIVKIWQGARGIAKAEYDYLVERRAWARLWDSTSYHAKPVDLAVLRNRELL